MGLRSSFSERQLVLTNSGFTEREDGAYALKLLTTLIANFAHAQSHDVSYQPFMDSVANGGKEPKVRDFCMMANVRFCGKIRQTQEQGETVCS